MTPKELAAIKAGAAEVAADTHWWNTAIYELAGQDVPALVAEVERARRLLLWLSTAYLDALTALRDDGDEPTTWGTHREMERIATTIAESAPQGEPFTPEQQKALEAWAAEVTL